MRCRGYEDPQIGVHTSENRVKPMKTAFFYATDLFDHEVGAVDQVAHASHVDHHTVLLAVDAEQVADAYRVGWSYS